MSIRSVVKKLQNVVEHHGVAAGGQFVGLAALRRQMCIERVHFFELARAPSRAHVTAGHTTRLATAADMADLIAEPEWQLTDLDVSDVERLFAAGHKCVLNVVEDHIAGYAWMNPDRIIVPKLRVAIPLPGAMVHVYRGFTHPSFRGRRIGCDRFAHWYRHMTEPHGVRVIVDFAFDNHATLARAERSGLDRVGSGTYVARGSRKRRWFTGALRGLEHHWVAPDIAHRDY